MVSPVSFPPSFILLCIHCCRLCQQKTTQMVYQKQLEKYARDRKCNPQRIPARDPTQFYVHADQFGGADLTSLIRHPCHFHLRDRRAGGRVGQLQNWPEYYVSHNILYFNLKGRLSIHIVIDNTGRRLVPKVWA